MDFRYLHFVLNILCFQPFLKKRTFFIVKAVHILLLVSGVILFYIHRDLILYSEDGFGQFADNYRLVVSVLGSFMIVIEPLFRFKNYDEILKLCKNFERAFKENFKHQFGISSSYRKLHRNLKVGIICFLLFYSLCEFKYFKRSMIHPQTRLFYLSFLVPTIIFNLKAFQILFFMNVFSSYLNILRALLKELNLEVLDNQKLKSKVYDSIIRKRLNKIISMHSTVVQMVENFNSSMGLSQIGILLAFKFYLYGDFYWIAFVTLHSQIRKRAVYSKFLPWRGAGGCLPR